jgi:hypothetical protein
MMKLVVGLFAVITFTVAGAHLVSASPGTPYDGNDGKSSCIGGSNANAPCAAASECPGGRCGGLAGFAPPTQGGLSCTRYINKRATVMPLKCTLACASDFASAISKGLTFDYTYCTTNWPQFSCAHRYEDALDKLDQGTCMNCLGEQARLDLYPKYDAVVATARDQIFCDNNPANEPFPDGHGFVSHQRDVAKCQMGILRNLAKAAKCLNLHCHAKLADLVYWNKPIRITNAECESEDSVKSCKAHYDLASSKLSGCPACVDKDAIWQSFQDSLDIHNGDIYCSDNP